MLSILQKIQTDKLKELFSPVIPGFGTNHALVYQTLFVSGPQMAGNLIAETGLEPHVTYGVLRDFVAWQIAQTAKSTPTIYSVDEPNKTLEQYKNWSKKSQADKNIALVAQIRG